MPNIIFGSLPKPYSVHFLQNIIIPQVHLTYVFYVCIQLFTHQTIKIFYSINVLIRSNYINKYILKF